MSRYKSLLIAAVILFGAVTMHAADSSVLSEVRFAARSNAEKNAGVWIDGQYLGYVKELTGAIAQIRIVIFNRRAERVFEFGQIPIDLHVFGSVCC